MFFADVIRNTAPSCPRFRFFKTGSDEQQNLPSDISVSYHDKVQTDRRADKFLEEIERVDEEMDAFARTVAEKTDLLCSGNDNTVQLEHEIDSIVRKLQELRQRRSDLEAASICSRLYGVFGLDYSVSESKMYYKGQAVRYFSDDGLPEIDRSCCRMLYQHQKGKVSVTAKRGRTGNVLYLKVYDHSDMESALQTD